MSKTSKELVKRLLAVALTLVMVIGFMPVAAIPVYATEVGAEETPAPSTEPSEEPTEPSTEPSEKPTEPTPTPSEEPTEPTPTPTPTPNLSATLNMAKDFTYDGKEHQLVKALDVKDKVDYTVEFKVSYSDNLGSEVVESTYTTIKDIVATEAGVYEVSATIAAEGYTDTVVSGTVTIKQADSLKFTIWDGDKKADSEYALELNGNLKKTLTLKPGFPENELKIELLYTDEDQKDSVDVAEDRIVKTDEDKDGKIDTLTLTFEKNGGYTLKVTSGDNNHSSEEKQVVFSITTKTDSGNSINIPEEIAVVLNEKGKIQIKGKLQGGNYGKISVPITDANKANGIKRISGESYVVKNGTFTITIEYDIEKIAEKLNSPDQDGEYKINLNIIKEKGLYSGADSKNITLKFKYADFDGVNYTVENATSGNNGWYVKNNDGSSLTVTLDDDSAYEVSAVVAGGYNQICTPIAGDPVYVYVKDSNSRDISRVQINDADGKGIKADYEAPKVEVTATEPDARLGLYLKEIVNSILFGVLNHDNEFEVALVASDEISGVDMDSVHVYISSIKVDEYRKCKLLELDYEAELKEIEERKPETTDAGYDAWEVELKAIQDKITENDNNLKALGEETEIPKTKLTVENNEENGSIKFSLKISDDCVCRIRYEMTDIAGNKVEGIVTNYNELDEKPENYLVIDKTPPLLTVTINDTNVDKTSKDETTYYNGEVSIVADVTEDNYMLISDGHGSLLTIAVVPNDEGEGKTIKDSNREKNINYTISADGDYTVTISCVDPSGNETTIERNIVVDTIKPVLSATLKDYNGYEGDISKDGDSKYYFNGAAEAGDEADTENATSRLPRFDIALTDKNPNLDAGVYAVIGKERDNITVAGVEDKVGTYKGTYTIDKDDGEYKFSLEHTDLAGNTGTSVDENNNNELKIYGTYIIDREAPELSVTFNNAANTIGDTHYYNSNINATFTVTEKYFDKELMVLNVGNNFKDEGMNFTDNGVIHTYVKTLKADGSTDGNYQMVVTGEDKAGNKLVGERVDENGKYTSENFVIDTQITAPTISGVEPGHAYKDKDISVSVKGDDTNFDQMTVVITKTYMANENGKTVQKTIEVYNETFHGAGTYSYRVPDGRDADGIYVVTATIRDKATNTATSTPVTFTVNRYGSVYEYVSGITEVNGKYVQKVGEELVIWEYSATELEGNNEGLIKNVGIYADGSKIDASDIKVELEHQNGGWYKYIYTIPAANFDTDAHYKVEISSESVNGVRSSNTKIQNLVAIDFFKDGTAPVLENVTGMEKSIYNEAEHEIKFNIYDSIGLASVKVLVNDTEVFVKEDFEDAMNYEGSVTLDESDSKQHVRFIITDLAGNVTDTDADGFDPDYTFERDLVISTNFWVRLRANTPLLIGCIAGVVVILALGVILIIRKKDKKEEEKTAAAK